MDVIPIGDALRRQGVRLGVERVGIVIVGVDLVRRRVGGGGSGGRGGIRVLGFVEEGKVVVTRGHGRRQADGNGDGRERRRSGLAPLKDNGDWEILQVLGVGAEALHS